MNNEQLVESFADFAKSKNIDKSTVVKILEDTLRLIIKKNFGTDDNFNIVINLEKGDLQIWRFRDIVSDDSSNIEDHKKISLTEARKIEADFEIGEEVAEEIGIDFFGRRSVLFAKQTLTQKIEELDKAAVYEKYFNLIGDIVTAEVYQILHKEVLLLDDEKNELILPKSCQIFKDRYRKGDSIRAVVHDVILQNGNLRIILSRTSPRFLEKLLENEVCEIKEGLVIIKKIARIAGKASKIAVESCSERIDAVGACIGIRGSRIRGITRELQNENISVITYTDNVDLYVTRALSPAQVSKIVYENEKILVHMMPDQISLAIGKDGQNIALATELVGKEIIVYRELEVFNDSVTVKENTDVLE